MTIDPLCFITSDNHKLQLGDLVKIKNKKVHTVNINKPFIFVFCIPQHRFGFILKEHYELLIANDEEEMIAVNLRRVPEPFVVSSSNLDFYWTPKLGLFDIKKF